ncbi:MAG: PAS domain-containing protein [Roseiflexaceae bacterium]|nr:PAS domain-containing protein [Roseiflexaceae bacterium]
MASREITHQYQLAAHIRQQALALDMIGQVVCVIDTAGLIRYCNQITDQIYGMPRELLYGQPAMNIADEHNRNHGLLVLAEVIGGATRSVELQLRRSDQSSYPARIDAAPLVDAQGRVYGVVSVITDLTKERQGEAERLQLERSLLASQRLESMSILAGGAAHDFNNLLVTILGNTELALMDVPAHSPIAANLRDIKYATKRAAELAQQMLAYAGSKMVKIEPVSINTVLREMSNLLRTAISSKIVIEHQLNDDEITIAADVTHLRQIIMNLVINAADAISPESGRISLRTSLEMIDDASFILPQTGTPVKAGSYAIIEVRDTGHGMSPEVMAHIFDPFFTTKPSGHGLGLAAVIGIVRQHHGGIRMRSTAGAGTSIAVCLPAAL